MWNNEKTKEYRRRYHILNRERIIKRVKEWAAKNREHRLAYLRNYAKNNSAKRVAYRKRRRQKDIQFRLKGTLSHRIKSSLNGYGAKKNHRRTEEIIGCDIRFFKNYIESRFQNGMTWGNYGSGNGKWNIDHRIPCDAFDLSDPDQQRQCFHYSNMQPLWWMDNMKKSNKMPEVHQAELI